MDKRTNMGYIITDSIHINDTEFVIGYKQDMQMQYAVWECINKNSYFFGYFSTTHADAERNLLKRALAARKRQDNKL